MRLCPQHEDALLAKLKVQGIAHLALPRAESDLLTSIWLEPDNDGPERPDDFEPRAVAVASIQQAALNYGAIQFHDWPVLCPECRFPKARFVQFGADSARNCWDRLTGGHA